MCLVCVGCRMFAVLCGVSVLGVFCVLMLAFICCCVACVWCVMCLSVPAYLLCGMNASVSGGCVGSMSGTARAPCVWCVCTLCISSTHRVGCSRLKRRRMTGVPLNIRPRYRDLTLLATAKGTQGRMSCVWRSSCHTVHGPLPAPLPQGWGGPSGPVLNHDCQMCSVHVLLSEQSHEASYTAASQYFPELRGPLQTAPTAAEFKIVGGTCTWVVATVPSATATTH